MPSKRKQEQRRGKKQRNRGGAKALSLGSSQDGARENRSAHVPTFRRSLCMSALGRGLNPLPDCLRVTMEAQFLGRTVAAAPAEGRFDVCGNSPFLPWNTTTQFPGPQDVANNVNGTAGYALLCGANGPYTVYRVYGSSIRVVITPSAAADNLSAVVTPYQGTAHANITLAGKSKWSKEGSGVFAGDPARITNSLSSTEFTGDTPEAVNFQAGVAAVYNAYPTSLWYWSCHYLLGSNAVVTSTITYRVNVVYDVVFENPQYDEADLDSITSDDKMAMSRHVKKMDLKRKAAEQDDARLDALIKSEEADDASDGGASRSTDDDAKVDDTRRLSASASRSCSSSTVKAKVTTPSRSKK